MKKNKTFLAALLIVLYLFSGCATADKETTTKPTEKSSELPEAPSTSVRRLYFANHEELVKYQSDGEGEHLADYYYQPKNMLEGMKFNKLSAVPNVYLTLGYTLETELAKKYASGSYENYRSSEVIYRYSINYVPGVTEKDYQERGGYEPVEYDGVTYYYSPEYRFEAKGDSIEFTDELIGHGIAYVTDEGDLMYIHLPAIAPLEEMIKYAEVERVYIK